MPTKVKFDPKNKELPVSRDRRNALDVHKLLRIFPIVSHHVVADIGCGPGFFTIPIAKMVFDGKVYALDIQKEMLDAVREEVAAAAAALGSEDEAAPPRRRKRKRKRKPKKEVGPWDRARSRVHGQLQQIQFAQTYLDVYEREGWKGANREKMRPTAELENCP